MATLVAKYMATSVTKDGTYYSRIVAIFVMRDGGGGGGVVCVVVSVVMFVVVVVAAGGWGWKVVHGDSGFAMEHLMGQ